MDLFVIDTLADNKLLQKKPEVIKKKFLIGDSKEEETTKTLDPNEDDEDDDDGDEDEDFGGLPPPSKDISHIIEKTLSKCSYLNETKKKSKSKDFDELIEKSTNERRIRSSELEFDVPYAKTNIEEELKTSKLGGIEKKHSVELLLGKKAKEIGRIERSKTKGKDWFNMPATEITEEVENDLKILQMRAALNPKNFYKKNDLKVLPKYFQIGTVQHSPLDYYSERDNRRNKKRTIVDELLADADFQKFNKRKYKEILEKNKRSGYHKANKKMKKLKKKR